MSARLILFAAAGIGAVFLYSAGKHDGRSQAAQKYERAAAKRERHVIEMEAEHSQEVAEIEINTKRELNSAKTEIDGLIDQLSNVRVRDECTSTGTVPEAKATPSTANGKARERVTVDTAGLREAAKQCGQCEVKLKRLQEWARGAVELCNGE